jgi:hypothetical protein
MKEGRMYFSHFVECSRHLIAWNGGMVVVVVVVDKIMVFLWVSALCSGVQRGGLGGSNHPLPPKFRSFDKAELNSEFRGKYILNNLIRIRGSLIYRLSGTPD